MSSQFLSVIAQDLHEKAAMWDELAKLWEELLPLSGQAERCRIKARELRDRIPGGRTAKSTGEAP